MQKMTHAEFLAMTLKYGDDLSKIEVYKTKEGLFRALAHTENVGDFETFDEAQDAALNHLRKLDKEQEECLRVALDCRLRRFVRLSDERTSRLWSRMAKWTCPICHSAAEIYTAEYEKVLNRYKRAREFSDYCQNKRYELRGL